MYQIKRPSESCASSYNDTKKLRTEIFNNKITNFECLSNELFYEIFEYLDGYDIYKAFSKLNFRFENLITCSSFLFKIKLLSETNPEFQHCCKNMIIPNRHHIISLDWKNLPLVDDLFVHFILDSSFVRLESIIFGAVLLSKSAMLLFHLKSLPRLSSLTIDIYGEDDGDLSDVYRMIFSLPSLKYNKLSLNSLTDDDDIDVHDNINAFIPLAVNEKLSIIEYLVIDHRCTIDELFSMLRHTPQLHHLTCSSSVELNYPTRIEQSVVLSSLTYIYFDAFFGDFDDFEVFMGKLSAPIETLIIDNIFDADFLEADRWKRFIIQHMSHLRRFEFSYTKNFGVEFEDIPFNELLNQFISPLWSDRQCIYEIKIIDDKISHSISFNRNIWLDIYKRVEIYNYCNRNIGDNFNQYFIMSNRQVAENYTNELLLPIQLSININGHPCFESPTQFFDTFKSTLFAVQFTHLNINCTEIPIGMFIRIIYLLPNLDSLKVSCLPLIPSGWSFVHDESSRFITLINNKITKVNLEKIITFKQVHFILYLCLRIEYFRVDIQKQMDFEMLMQFILLKASTYIPHLYSLCLSMSNANDEIIHRLQSIIKSRKLLTNYIIKRIDNDILLKWNRHYMMN